MEQPPWEGTKNGRFIKLKIDKDFPYEYSPLIDRAIRNLEIATSNKVKFQIIWNVSKPDAFYKYFRNPDKTDQGFFMWYLNKEDRTQVTKELHDKLQSERNYVGFLDARSYERAANIVIFSNALPEHMYLVILHELGHLLHMEHDKEHDSIMFPFVKNMSTCITQWDAEQLCKLYNCIPNPQCVIK